MCNKTCSCENEDKCSIKGFLGFGACCSFCVDFDENYTCLKSELAIQKFLMKETEWKILPKAFCMKQTKKTETPIQRL